MLHLDLEEAPRLGAFLLNPLDGFNLQGVQPGLRPLDERRQLFAQPPSSRISSLVFSLGSAFLLETLSPSRFNWVPTTSYIRRVGVFGASAVATLLRDNIHNPIRRVLSAETSRLGAGAAVRGVPWVQPGGVHRREPPACVCIYL